MDLSVLQKSWLVWSFGLMVFFPLLMLLLSESILRIQGKKPALANTLKITRNLVLPILAVFLALTQVLGVESESQSIRLVKTLLLVATIHLSLSFANSIFFVEAGTGTWQANVPKLLRDLVRGILILLGAAIVLSLVWKLNLGSLITALGVSSIVIGLALQDTLGNLFSGITLLFGRPFKLGDWIETSGTVGKVIQVNWRAVHLCTRENEMLVVPNSVLAKEVFRNFNRPVRLHVEPVDIGFSYDDPPNRVKQILRETAIATQGVLSKPAPIIQTVNYGDSSIDYRVKLHLADYAKVPQVRDEFMTRIWYAAKRYHLNIPFPIRTLYHQPMLPITETEVAHTLVQDLKQLPFFSNLDESCLIELIAESNRRFYGEREPIIAVQAEKVELHLILDGQVQLFIHATGGQNIPVADVGRGDFFGTMAVFSNAINQTGAKALTDVDVLVFNTEAIHIMLRRSPQLSQALGEIIEARRKAIALAHQT